MDKIILGILLIQSMSIYELRGYIQKNLNSFCSDSMGSIQAALKKLSCNHEIECCESFEHGVTKKTFSITEEGILKFEHWIGSPVSFAKCRDIEGSKLFFLGMSSDETRMKMLQTYLNDLLAEQKHLQEIARFIEDTKDGVIERNVKRYEEDALLSEKLMEVSKKQNLEEVISNVYRYQLNTLEYGLKKCEFDIAWVRELIHRETRLL